MSLVLLLASCAATRESYAAVSKFSTPEQLRNLRWDAITCLVQAINGLEVDAAGGVPEASMARREQRSAASSCQA